MTPLRAHVQLTKETGGQLAEGDGLRKEPVLAVEAVGHPEVERQLADYQA